MKTGDIDGLVNPHLAGMETFKPVDPPEVLAKRAGIPEDRIIRLNANENPYGASSRAAAAMARVKLHVYPDPQQRKIRRALAGFTGFEPEQLIAGAGSDELIDLMFRLFVLPGDTIIECVPTFGMYVFDARVAGVNTKSIDRDEIFEIDVEAVMNAIGPRVKIIFLNSPNNPTGNLASESQVRAILDSGLIVVVDEAYCEFAGQTVAGMVPEHENLVVLRTMSKWAGLAGLRIGYGIMSPKLVRYLLDIKQPYNVNVAAEEAVLASLEDADTLLQNVRLIVEERDRMYCLLESIDGVKPWPSRGNYVLCDFQPGRASELYEGLAAQGIFVRMFGHQRLRDSLRISVGTPEQTDAVIGALHELV